MFPTTTHLNFKNQTHFLSQTTTMSLKPYQTHYSPPFTILPFKNPTKMSLKSVSPTRRTTLVSTITTIISPTLFPKTKTQESAANALDFRMTVPDQTVEEAMNGMQSHAQSLLQVKELLALEEWKEAQRELRKSSALLKQDLYTLIQDKPGVERPQLRKLYSVLFNSVTSLDYAARDKDVTLVRQCYDDIVIALDQMLSMISK